MRSELSWAISPCTARIWRFSSAREAFGRRPGNHCTFQNVTEMVVGGAAGCGDGVVCAKMEAPAKRKEKKKRTILGFIDERLIRERCRNKGRRFTNRRLSVAPPCLPRRSDREGGRAACWQR